MVNYLKKNNLELAITILCDQVVIKKNELPNYLFQLS